MEMKEIYIEAKSTGKNVKNQDWVALIRMIQRIEGNPECFRRTGDYCDQKMCSFRGLCFPLDKGMDLSL
jgi:hypothetical protein